MSSRAETALLTFVFDAILVIQLPDQKLRIALHDDGLSAQLQERFQAHQQCLVLCDIVGRLTEMSAQFFHDRAIFVDDRRTAAGLARIASRRAVDHYKPRFLRFRHGWLN